MFAALVRDYGDIDAEVAACRTDAALFDFSFMARGTVSGPTAFTAVQSLTSRPLTALWPGRILYALRVDASGFVRADLTIWQTGSASFEVFSGRREDIAALPGGRDCSDETCMLSVQGPRSLAALSRCCDVAPLAALDYFEHAATRIAGVECRVGRLGYTGERGFEIVAPVAAKAELWRALAGQAHCAGFAAADVLRIEAGFALFANDFRPGVTPAEAGLARFAVAGAPPRVAFVGFTARSAERPILFSPPPNLSLPTMEGEIAITSAAWSRGTVVGLGFVRAGAAETAFVDSTGRFMEVRRASVPFVDPGKRRVRGGWRLSDYLPDRS
jgi:glycine cleavage system aminomethyltransferase T